MSVIVLLTLILIVAISLITIQAPINIPRPILQLSTQGYVETSVDIELSNLKFSSGCYSLSMVISEAQALSIRNGLNKIIDVRPLTHDIFKETIENFGLELLMVRIESFREGIYYAKIFLKQENKILELDSRPSDAVALAIRTDAKIYFKQDVLEEYGTKIC